MNPKPSVHTMDTLGQVLNSRGLDFLSVVAIAGNSVILLDNEYGQYSVDLKTFCPSTATPLHKKRRHKNRVAKKKNQFVGTLINGVTVLDVFYGPDAGYKNRSFFLEVRLICGHTAISTYAHLKNHRRTPECLSCNRTEHGVRKKIDGVLQKRTATYNHWVKVRKKLPEKYQDFTVFKSVAGDKPYKTADLVISGDELIWVNRKTVEDEELNLMAMALRQAFRYSDIYKSALVSAKVETEKGSRYRCAICKELFVMAKVQVDHIDPVVPVDGTPLMKDTLIDRVWTKNVQILDKGCHAKKSSEENKQRRLGKKK